MHPKTERQTIKACRLKVFVHKHLFAGKFYCNQTLDAATVTPKPEMHSAHLHNKDGCRQFSKENFTRGVVRFPSNIPFKIYGFARFLWLLTVLQHVFAMTYLLLLLFVKRMIIAVVKQEVLHCCRA